MSILKTLIKFWIILLFLPIWAQAAAQEPIPVDQAFQLTIEPTTTDSINLHWQIAPNYYLYKERISINVLSPKEAIIGALFMPTGIERTDVILGQHWVYENNLLLSVPVLNPTKEPLKLLINYQGCASWGFCYPPQTKLITLNNLASLTAKDIVMENYLNGNTPVSNVITKQTLLTPQSEQMKIYGFLENQNRFFALMIFFGLGFLLAFTPCVLPMLPILSGLIVGHGAKISTKKAFLLSLAYILGMALSFAIAGALAALFGSSIQAAMQKPWVIVLFSAVFVILALSLFGFYEIQLPHKLMQKINSLSHKQKTGNYLGVFVMGILSTLIVSPCVSAPLVGTLTYITQTGDALFGAVALFTLALGMGIPLLVMGSSLGKLLPKAGHWMYTVKYIFGVMMLAIAIWMLSRILPGALSLLLWATLAVVTAIFMGALNKTPEHWSGKLWKGLGIILFTYGILLIIGAAMGNSDVFNPLQIKSNTITNQLSFIPVKSIADVKKQLALAKKLNKPVMLDFYADWCVACKINEKYTFSNEKVSAKLNQFVLLRADITANDATDQQLMQQYAVIAPPALIFFDKNGDLVSNATIVGEISPEKFLPLLKAVSN